MASTSTFSCNTERELENEYTNASEEIAISPSTSATPSVGTLFSSCFNWCTSFFLSLCSTPRHSNDFQGIATSPSHTDAFEQVVPSTSSSGRSTLMPDRKLPYDVFINHRGLDVKHTLAATLYKTLTGMGLRVFLDKEELECGDFFPTETEEAMRSALLHIAIFSKNYAQSPWCLAELSFMLKTGTQIVPVFYHVQPDDVRYAKGVYAKAFCRYRKKGRYTSGKLQEWKNALQSVSYNFGDTIHNDDDEGILMKKIVGSVLKVIKNVPFVVANHPVGLDEALKDFEKTTIQTAESHDSVQILGIWGMGGSGKTTLAKQLYNHKYKIMEKSSFLLDIRDAASNNKLHKKQKKLLEDLGLQGVSIDNVEEGKGILASRLRSIRVLIILDDVDNAEQLNVLVPNKDSLGLGSLIVVTSRDFEVLRCWGISSIYKMKALDRLHAKQLFCWHAFLQPSPHQAFENLVEKFLNVCDGLPLSLKVFGAQLYGISDKDYWEIQLHKISRILPKDIKERLKVSYDALDGEEKQIFLDIACFFIGENKNSAIVAWDGSGWNGQHSWERLLNKCLVELNDDDFDDDHMRMFYPIVRHESIRLHGRIRMHDHLRDLGREIANHQSPYRLWSSQQIINVGNEVHRIAIRGIMATAAECISQTEEFPRCSQDGKLIVKASEVNYNLEPSLLGLKFFYVRGNYYNQVIGDLSRELVWLRWDGIEQRNLRALSSLKNLRVLELYGKSEGEHHLEELWEIDKNAPVQLRELVIHKCKEFQGFPKSIGCLRHLKKVVVRNGSKVRSLPEEFCLLQSLEYLELDCLELSSLPENIGQLSKLRWIKIKSEFLTSLPISMGDWSSLISLYIINCHKLECLPDSLGRLNLLRILLIYDSGVKSLPKSVSQLINLQMLYVNMCPISELVLEAGLFTCLKGIHLRQTDVSKISISEDCHLENLNLYDNANLKKIEVLPNRLKSISLRESPKLFALPSFAQSAFLRVFVIKGCYGVKKIQGLEHCRALEWLQAHTRWEEADIESLERMERLKEVEFKAINISSVKGCIQSMQKWPKDRITVCTRAVPDAATLVNSFVNSFPNLSVVDSFANQKIMSKSSLKWPSTTHCVLLCFVVNCESPKTEMGLIFKRSNFEVFISPFELEGGKWVCTTVLTQHSHFQSICSGDTQSWVCLVEMGKEKSGEGEVEKGVLVMGEEERVWEAFTRLCVLLSN